MCSFHETAYKKADRSAYLNKTFSFSSDTGTLSSAPSSIVVEAATSGFSSSTAWPNPLPPDVANSTMRLPAKSCASKNVP